MPSLEALATIAEVVGVVCQPDRPAGRGLEVKAPPVKQKAIELGLEVVQPLKIRTAEFAAWVREKHADLQPGHRLRPHPPEGRALRAARGVD